MLRKNSHILLCVLCIVGAQVVFGKSSQSADAPKANIQGTTVIDQETATIDSFVGHWYDYSDETKRLTDFVAATTDDSLQGESRKCDAIRLLGEMRAACAVTVLTKNLMYIPKGWHHDPYRGPMDRQPPQVDYLCAEALIKIGSPAIGEVIWRAGHAPSKDERHLAAYVLMEIDGPEVSLVRLQKNSADASQTGKLNLSEVMDYIRTFDLQAPFPAETPEVKK